jgi:hypothetical protein
MTYPSPGEGSMEALCDDGDDPSGSKTAISSLTVIYNVF